MGSALLEDDSDQNDFLAAWLAESNHRGKRTAIVCRVGFRKKRAVKGIQDEFAPIGVDAAIRQLHVAGNTMDFTFKEYELVVFLFENRGRIMSRAQLLEKVWSTDTYIGKVRIKLDLNNRENW